MCHNFIGTGTLLPRISISWSDVELLPVQGPLAFTLSYPYAVGGVPFGCSPPRVVSLDNFTYLPGRAEAPSGNGLLIFILATSVFQCGALPWPPHGCRSVSSTASPLPSVGSRGSSGPLSRASEILSLRNSMYFSQLCVDWPAHSSTRQVLSKRTNAIPSQGTGVARQPPALPLEPEIVCERARL